jgi:hypothetical protein
LSIIPFLSPIDLPSLVGAALVSSATDTTAGKLVTPGFMGLGGAAITLTSADNLDSLDASGFFTWNSSSVPTNAPGAFFSVLLHIKGPSSTYSQTVSRIGASSAQGETLFRARSGGTWNAWRRMDVVSGSNANGSFLTLAGITICWGTVTMTSRNITAVNVFRTDNVTQNLPVTYGSAPMGFVSVSTLTGWANVRSTTTSSIVIREFGQNSNTDNNTAHWLTIGA